MIHPSPRAVSEDILRFWFEQTTPDDWFSADAALDRTIAAKFGVAHERASAGELNVLRADPRGALSLIVLLDQFSRNLFRDSPRAFAQDAQAREIAAMAIGRRFDLRASAPERAFIFMPFMHSEEIADQNRCVRLFKARLPGSQNLPYALGHRAIIRRFGRFPHRNKILGRESTTEELSFLTDGGFNPA